MRRYGTHLNCPAIRDLATFGKPEQTLDRAGGASDARFGRSNNRQKGLMSSSIGLSGQGDQKPKPFDF